MPRSPESAAAGRSADPAAADLAAAEPTGGALLQRALEAVGRTRAHGVHYFGHLLGIAGSPPADGRSRLRLVGEPPGPGAPELSQVALAMLADMALGAAVRSRLEPGMRVTTVTLAIQYAARPAPGPVAAEGRARLEGEPRGLAQCTLRSRGRPIAQGQAWFAGVPLSAPSSRGIRSLPWQQTHLPVAPAPAPEELDQREAAAVAATFAAAERAAAHGSALSEELLRYEWVELSTGYARGQLRLGPELGNIVGDVQGGLLFGAAALVAREALAHRETASHRASAPHPAAASPAERTPHREAPTAEGVRLVDGAYHFLRPARGAWLTGEARLLRRGRRVAFAEAHLSVDGHLVGTGLFTFQL